MISFFKKLFKKEKRKEQTKEELIKSLNRDYAYIADFFGDKINSELSKLPVSERKKKELEIIDKMCSDIEEVRLTMLIPSPDIYSLYGLLEERNISKKQYDILKRFKIVLICCITERDRIEDLLVQNENEWKN